MGITISEIQDKTLLKYAKTADVDKDGDLNEEESASLFTTLDSKCSEAEEQQQFWKRQDSGITDDIMTGGAMTAAGSLCVKKFRSLLGFGILLATNTVLNCFADRIQLHRFSNKVENYNSAIKEFNQLKSQATA